MNNSSPNTIAVLPFTSLSPGVNEEYFSDGITDEIINMLVKVDGLLVTARTSSFHFKNKSMDVREVGSSLGVKMILEGSVRKNDNAIRVSAQLIDVSSGFNIWSENWTKVLTDVFEIQDEIANEIVKKVQVKDSFHELSQVPVVKRANSIEAYNKYLKGKYYRNLWTKYSTYKAIKQFELSIEKDPSYVYSYYGLFSTYLILGVLGVLSPQDAFSEAQKYLKKLQILDPALPETNLAEASICFWKNWEFEKATELIRKVITSVPSSADAWQHLAMALAGQKQFKEANAAVDNALNLDPLSYNIVFCKATILYLSKEYKQAIEFIDRNLKLNPYFINFYVTKGFSLMHSGRFEEAIDTFSNIPIGENKTFKDKGAIGVVKAFEGKKKEAEEILKYLQNADNKDRNPISTLHIAAISAKLGNFKEALIFLEFGLKARLPGLIYVAIDPTWEMLANCKEFYTILPEELKSQVSFLKKNKYAKSSLCITRVSAIKKRLAYLMEIEHCYLQNNLSLKDLAEKVKEPSIIVSQVFNQHMNTSFYNYVNEYRLKEFEKKIKSSKYNDFTLVGIAGICGFSSKSAFNGFVKQETNKTPKEFIKSLSN